MIEEPPPIVFAPSIERPPADIVERFRAPTSFIVDAMNGTGALDWRIKPLVGRSLVGVGAIRRLDETHAELKAMHTRAEARGQGVGQAMLTHLLRVAETRGYQQVSLETGTMDAFAPARALYRKAGFRRCPPFGPYTVNPYSVCMTLVLDPARQA